MTNNKDGDSDGDNDDDDEDNDDDDDDNNDDVYKDDYYDKYCFSYMPVSFYASCFKLASVTFDVSRTSRHIPRVNLSYIILPFFIDGITHSTSILIFNGHISFVVTRSRTF